MNPLEKALANARTVLMSDDVVSNNTKVLYKIQAD
jgi:hypothetical protein